MATYQAIKISGSELLLDDCWAVPLPPGLEQGTSARQRLDAFLQEQRAVEAASYFVEPADTQSADEPLAKG